MALSDDYLNLITSQHRDKPKYTTTLKKLFAYTDDVFNAGIYLNDEFDLDVANGIQQDTIGIIIGQQRAGLTDEQYRVLQKIKIIKNHWNGKIKDLYEKWMQLLGIPIIIHDNQDMTLDVFIDSNSDAQSVALMQLLGVEMVVPKPMGVNINCSIKYTKTFPTYAGMAIAHTGERDLKISLPQKATQNIYVGMAIAHTGKRDLKISLPQKATQNIYAGALLTYQGHITIPAKIE